MQTSRPDSNLYLMLRQPMIFRFRLLWAMAFLMIIVTKSVNGQTALPTTTAAEPSSTPAASESDLRFSVIWNARTGSFTYVSEKWGELHLSLENSRAVPRDLLCATSFDESPQLQFGRRIWMPARSKLRITHPILIPKYSGTNDGAVKLHSLVIEGSAKEEVLVRNETGQLVHDGAMLVTSSPRNTGIVVGPDANDHVSSEVLDLVVANRVNLGLNNKVTLLADPFLPPDETSLNYLDHLVIAENRIADDLAALSAIRRWLHAGGRLWIMLDRVDPVIMERLFGDDFRGYVVDRVGLTTVQIDRSPTPMESDIRVGEPMEYDEPVEMARLVAPDMNVSHLVNGWPAALNKRYGDGRLLVTTLGPRGWMKPRSAENRKSDDPLKISEFVPLYPMSAIGAEIFSRREPDLLPQQTIEPFVRERIGYRIPPWGLIVGTLGSFLLALIVVGVWLLRIDRIEHLGWIGSALAVGVSLLLLTIGRTYRHSVPGTIACTEIAQALAGTDDVRTQGAVAVYHPEGSDALIQTTQGGQLWPDMTGLKDSTRRLVTIDLGQSHWENLAQSAGLRVSPFTNSKTIVRRIEAHATLDSSGLVGTYSGELPAGTDAMLATGTGRMGVDLRSDGSFTTGGQHVFQRDQYLGASYLTDEQGRRRRILEKLFNNTQRRDFPERTQLMFWSDRWQDGFQFGDDLERQSAALVAVPLTLHRPSDGTEILIPSPLLPFRNRNNPDGTAHSAMWDSLRKEWQQRSAPISTWLSFHVPRELIPLSITKARLDFSVSGPVGRIEIMGLKNGVITRLQTVVDPVGSFSLELDDAEVLSLSDEGVLSLGLSAGDPSSDESSIGNAANSDSTVKADPANATGSSNGQTKTGVKANYWQFESLSLQLWAKITAPTVKD